MSLNKTSQRGVSLVELLVTLIIGLIVIGASTTVFIGTLGANSSQMRISRLNSELRSAMTYVTRDLRRAGYNNWTVAQLEAGNFTNSGQTAPAMGAAAAAVSYDINNNGGTQRYGFQLSNDGAIQAQIDTGSWNNLTDPSIIQITAFTITNRSPAAINPVGAVVSVTVPIYTIEITGRLTTDNTVTRTIRETVRIRNVTLGPV
jgi:prepilin peptidase dependent protein B